MNKARNARLTPAPEYRLYFTNHPNTVAITTSERDGIIFLGPLFFSESEFDRAITLIHEAVHRAGSPDARFGANQDEGSRNLTNILRAACQ
jgi:hypothetical protein